MSLIIAQCWWRMTPRECHETPKLHSMIWQNDGNCLYILKNILLHTFLGSYACFVLVRSHNSHKQSCYSYDIWILFKLTLTVLLLPLGLLANTSIIPPYNFVLLSKLPSACPPQLSSPQKTITKTRWNTNQNLAKNMYTLDF